MQEIKGIELNVLSAGGGLGERLRRKFWMRLVPGSKHYQCDCCQAALSDHLWPAPQCDATSWLISQVR